MDHRPPMNNHEDDVTTMMEDLRRGPWTDEEDQILSSYIAKNGEGKWNSLARCAGLNRTGKSCRLRWLNYLRPDVRRGNISLQEQLLILELHSHWGNRWSKIAKYLPGRTDNEIKNYWRTRVQKHAKQLKCDVNSQQFKDSMRYIWMPRLVEKIQAAAPDSDSTFRCDNTQATALPTTDDQTQYGFTNSSSSTGGYAPNFSNQVSPISDLIDDAGFAAASNFHDRNNYSGYGDANTLVNHMEYDVCGQAGLMGYGGEDQMHHRNGNNVDDQWMMMQNGDHMLNVDDFLFNDLQQQ